MTTDPLDLGALAQAELLRSGALSSQALVRGYLARITRLDPRLHAFVDVHTRRALAAARRADDARSRVRAKSAAPAPLFAGVPIAIKDTDAVRFAWNRAGSRAYRYVWMPLDAPAIALLRRAGFVILGKTSTSELALMPVVEPDLHPPTANPWSTAHSAGGSSGGSASAVAAGLLPIAHAADGGGSIRIPASFCHLFGYKASRGLIPDFYAAMDHVGLSLMGSVAHHVEDAAAVLDVYRGHGSFPATPEALAVRAREAPPRGLRVALCLRSPIGEVDAEIAAAVERIAHVLEGLGHHVEAVEPPAGSLDDFLPVYGRLAANPPALAEQHFQPVTRWLRALGRRVTKAQAVEANRALAERILAWFGDFDLALSPTVGRPVPRIGEFDGLTPEAQFRAAAEIGGFTAAFNITGQPSASIPAGLSAAGLPMGAMLTARRGEDVTLLQLCHTLEGLLEWPSRRPPLAQKA
ncbi:MAG: amidase [Deltaproteobacteria bacterium]|nr:amidase [Deltaproteobacteria bacterium]